MTESQSDDDPKHAPVAVALGYKREEDAAPRVLAGGRGAIAEQILDIAFAHGIKVREDANLAQLLSAVDIDSDIPAEAFAAVAEILVYVYRANGRLDDLLSEDAVEPASPFDETVHAAAPNTGPTSGASVP